MEQANITVLAVSSQPHPAPATSLGVNHASVPNTRNSKAGLWGGAVALAVPHPNLLSPQPCLPLTTPGFACAQANKPLEEGHSTGAGGGQEIAGTPRQCPDLRIKPRLGPGMFPVTQQRAEPA